MKFLATIILFTVLSVWAPVTYSIAGGKVLNKIFLQKFEIVTGISAEMCPARSGKKLEAIQIKLDLVDKDGKGLRPTFLERTCWYVPKNKKVSSLAPKERPE